MRNIDKKSFPANHKNKEYAAALVGGAGAPFSGALIGVTYPDPAYEIRRTCADVTVFEYVLEGEGALLLNGKWQTARAGNVYILRAGEPHRYRADARNPWMKMWINYDADYISPLLDAYGLQSGIYRSENARAYFEQLLEHTRSEQSPTLTGLDVADCVARIVHAVASERLTDRSDAYRIKEALGAAVFEQLNLDALAAKLHLSKSGLIRTFKKSYGITPYAYLLSRKVEAAKLLLRDTRMSVKEIAERLCICDEHYFSSLFLAHVGVRPRSYREEAQFFSNEKR